MKIASRIGFNLAGFGAGWFLLDWVRGDAKAGAVCLAFLLITALLIWLHASITDR